MKNYVQRQYTLMERVNAMVKGTMQVLQYSVSAMENTFTTQFPLFSF